MRIKVGIIIGAYSILSLPFTAREEFNTHIFLVHSVLLTSFLDSSDNSVINWRFFAYCVGIFSLIIHISSFILALEESRSVHKIYSTMFSSDCQALITVDVFLTIIASGIYFQQLSHDNDIRLYLLIAILFSPGAASAYFLF